MGGNGNTYKGKNQEPDSSARLNYSAKVPRRLNPDSINRVQVSYKKIETLI